MKCQPTSCTPMKFPWMKQEDAVGFYDFTVGGTEPHPNHKKTNYIRTTKTTLLTFLPISLFGQFMRFYNLYFLLGAILVLLPLGLAPVSPFTQIAPLIVVLGVTCIKEAIEEFSRYRSDRRANNIQYKVVVDGEQKKERSRSLHPGQIIFVEKGQQFPADLIILSSSHEEGLAYIETAELDGETNLKKRQASASTLKYRSDSIFKDFKAVVECDQPNEYLYQFQGRATIGEEVIPLNQDQILLRGSILRNTQYVYGIVCYVGLDTKIMRNLKSSSLKFSSLEGRLNKLVVAIFVANAVILLISCLLSGSWQAHTGKVAVYIDWNLNGATAGAAQAMSYYILYTYMIPISLFVTIEISRLLQSLFMFWDDGMRSEDKIRMRPRNSNLNEDLGRVEHIFSDKTGTLTQNIMSLQYWFVNGKSIQEDGSGELTKYAKGEIGTEEEKENVSLLMRAIAVCHTVVPSVDELTEKIIYEGDSPDETALLEALRKNGVFFNSRTTTGIGVSFLDNMEEYKILRVIEFNSTRKRMSIIVRTPKGNIELFCKGADNIILERAAQMEQEQLDTLNTAISDFSKQGLRTLLIAHLPLTEEEYEAFNKKYHEAEISMEDREERMDAVSNNIEQNLTIIGATAVEDKLQEDVAETIEYLRRCGIKVWMLTGDKLETAISIGKSTKFISEGMEEMIIDTATSLETTEKLDSYLSEIGGGSAVLAETGTELKNKKNYAIIITGNALRFVLEEENTDKFVALSDNVSSIICCRVSPLQKSKVVDLIRKKKKTVCLSIGDGANDVSMIQKANIGCGIIGLEGTQAVRASDFAFKEFRALRRLVSVHGRYSYIRMSKLILFSFYKNLTFIYPQFYVGFYFGWSAVALYHELVLTCFNLFFTSLPPLFLAIFEKDIEIESINKYPQSYLNVKNDYYFNAKRMAEWGLSSAWQGLALFFTIEISYGEGVLSGVGQETGGFFLISVVMAYLVLTTVLIKWGFIIHHWNIPYLVAGLLSYIVFVGFMFLFASEGYATWDEDTSAQGLVALAMGTGYFYMTLIFGVSIALLPDFVYHYVKRNYFPEDFEIIQEEERKNKRKMKKVKQAEASTQVLTIED